MIFADSIPVRVYLRISLTIAETIIANPKSPSNIAIRKTSKAIGIITITNKIPKNDSSSSEKSNFVNSSNIHEPSPEPAMKKFAERRIITNPTSSEIGRRTNAQINGTGVTAKLALLSSRAYIDANFPEPRSAMVESSSDIFHSNSLPQCGQLKYMMRRIATDAAESSFISPSQCGQRISTMNLPNANRG